MKSHYISAMFWFAWTAATFAAEPFARTGVEDNGRIVPGQQVRIAVDVFVPDFFTSPPQFPLFDLPDAIVTLPEERAQSMVETIDGVQYAGIRRVYAVIPETSGTYNLPSVVITLGYSNEGIPIRGQAELPPASFTVTDPEGAGSAFAARALTITQAFDRDPSSLTVGDALVRTVTVFAEDTQAMMIPALPPQIVEGMKLYAKSPRLADGVEGDGRKTGSTRTEWITYVVEREGEFDIPAVSYPWFDVEAHIQAVANLPATTVKVRKAPAASTGLAPQVDQTGVQQDKPDLPRRWVIATAVLALASAGFFMVILKPGGLLRATLAKRRENRRISEPQKFKSLLASARNDDPMTIYRALEDWTRAAGYPSIDGWLASFDGADIARETQKLERELFAGEHDRPCFDRTAFIRSIRAARGRALNSKVVTKPSSLPGLNPSQPIPARTTRLLR